MKIFAIAVLLVLLMGCSKVVVERNDALLLTYTGMYSNGTIFDSNDQIKAAEFPNAAGREKLTVTVGTGSLIPGFENALIGMKEGESKTVKVSPAQGYGPYIAERVASVPKKIILPREIGIERNILAPIASLQAKQNASVGEFLETENFIYNITAKNATHATLYLLDATKDPIQLEESLWKSKLVRSTADKMHYAQIVASNESVNTPQGPYLTTLNTTHIILNTRFKIGQEFHTEQGIVRITRETDDSVTLDFNHPLAGQELTFDIRVDTIEKRT
jgi:FKBP-type peptidyl-prolyl cis-trans isomerase 2